MGCLPPFIGGLSPILTPLVCCSPDIGDLTGLTSIDGSVTIVDPGGPVPDLSVTPRGGQIACQFLETEEEWDAGASEILLKQRVVRLDSFSPTPPNLVAYLGLLGKSTNGATLRVRMGGTIDAVNGTIIIETGLPAAGWTLITGTGALVNPAAAVLLKLTMLNGTGGDVQSLREDNLTLRAAA